MVFLAAWWRHAPEWLTSNGFHLSGEWIRPLATQSLIPFGILQFGSLLLFIAGWHQRGTAFITFGCLAIVTLIDRPSAYSINDIYLYTFAVFSLFPGPLGNLGKTALAPIRLLQLALVVIYFGSGWHKAVYGDWIDSPTTLWTSVQGIYMTDVAAWSVHHIPIPFWTVLQYAILAFELFSPVLFFSPKTRLAAIVAGCLFHLGIALFMDKLIFFSLQMMSFYVLFPIPRRNRAPAAARFFP